MENERKILINRIDVINKVVNCSFINETGKCDIATNYEYDTFANSLTKECKTIQLAVEYGASLLNLMKKELWKKCSDFKRWKFILTFQSLEDENNLKNGLQNEYDPIAKLNLEFVNSLAIFLLWRNKEGLKKDEFIFDLGKCNGNIYFSFSQALYRYLYIINKQYNFTKETFNITYINEDGEIKKASAEFNRAKGAFGVTGFPIIPITADFYQVSQKNIFSFLFEFMPAVPENCVTRLDKMHFLAEKVLHKNKYWENLVPKIDHTYIPVAVICADSMYLILKGLSNNKSKEKSKEVAEKIYGVIKNANVLTFMMFASVYIGIYNPDGVIRGSQQTGFTRTQILSDYKTFFDVFESCNAYAMGCLQLMENVLCYTRGGFFSLRALVRSSARNFKRRYTQFKTFYKNAEHNDLDFLQICIADLANADACSLLDRFADNLKKKKGAKILIPPTIEDMFWAPELKSEEFTPVSKSENTITYYDYRCYLSDNETISHHYGLQIFVSSVLEARGHFYVSSGNINECRNFDSAGKYLDKDNRQFIEYLDMSENPDSDYYCGTRYYIQLPIVEVSKTRNSAEYIGEYMPNDLTFEALDKTYDEITLDISKFFGDDFQKYNDIKDKLRADAEGLGNFVDKKIDLINDIIHQINKEADKEAGSKIIDLSDNVRAKIPIVFSLPDNAHMNESLFMEVMAKIIFGLCAQKDGYRNIVLKKFNKTNDIANFVRLYSRFYDRFGMNTNILPSPQILLLYQKSNVKDIENEKSEENGSSPANKNPTIDFALSGRYLGIPLYEYCQFSGGKDIDTDDILKSALKTIGRRLIADGIPFEESKNNPHCFDKIKVESENGEIKHWQRDLYAVLTTDLTNSDRYGVRINDCVTHMHISGVHLDRFYKVESLFTNAYWAGKFAEELTEKIFEQCTNKNSEVVLYGYERILEPMFIRTKKLCFKKGLSVRYMIYDSGYHYSAEHTSKEYISGYDGAKEVLQDCKLFYVMAISVTLNTYNTMYQSLQRMSGNVPAAANTFYHTVIQIYNENETTQEFSKEIVDFGSDKRNQPKNKFDGAVKFKLKKVDNGDNGEWTECSYLVAIPAKCYKPNDCPLCMLEEKPETAETVSLLSEFEKAVFSTDDTSLVPSFMVEPNNKVDEPCEASIVDSSGKLFFSETKSGDDSKSLRYLYQETLFHKHLVRNGAHYQNYIRSEMLIEELSRHMNSNEGDRVYNLPFKMLQERFAKNIKKYIHGKVENYINILVAPYHNNNQMLPSLINDKLFMGKAHIISFNATKIFRSNFVAEFDNYSTLLDKINKRLQGAKNASEIVRFYYVDDQINTGNTFSRTRSLASELFERAGSALGKLEFTAIFVLTDRHSTAFRRDLIENTEMFFPLFTFLAPNLRSSGDTCPLCKQVAQDKEFLKIASLDSTAGICYRRIQEHKAEEISNANEKWAKEKAEEAQITANNMGDGRDSLLEADKLNDTSFNEKLKEKAHRALIKANDMRRFHAENLLFEAIKSDYNSSCKKFRAVFQNESKEFSNKEYSAVMQLAPLYDVICRKVEAVCREHDFSFDNGDSKIEYMISFVKCLSRPFFSYRPYVATAAIKFLKDIIQSLKNMVERLDTDPYIVFNSFCKKKVPVISIAMPPLASQYEKYISLLLVCVSGLAGLNSTYLLNLGNLDNVLFILKKLLSFFKDEKEKSFFDENIGLGVNNSLKSMSYADYVRFSVFRVLQTGPYGQSRRLFFQKRILNKLSELSIQVHKRGQKNLLDLLFFYCLVYLESSDTKEYKDRRIDRIKRLRDKIIEKNQVKAPNNNDQITTGNETVIKFGIERNLDELFDNCFPYILKTKNKELDAAEWFVPLTVEGYNDAFNLGYDILTGEKSYVPIESGRDEGQLCGRLKLVKEAYDALNKYGISFSNNSISAKNDYVFVKFRFYDYDLKIAENSDKSLLEQNDSDPSLYLRFERNSLIALGTECMKASEIEFGIKWDDNVNNDAESYQNLAIIMALGEAVKHRAAIIKVMHDLLDTNAVDKLVAERESSSALSMSKAAKHGNAQMEQIAGIASFNQLAKRAQNNINTNEGEIKTDDVMFASMQRLLANRLLTAMYRVESTLFIEESKINTNKKNFTYDEALLIGIGKDGSRRAAEEIGYKLLHEGFYIFGKADSADHSDNIMLKIGFKVCKDEEDFQEGVVVNCNPNNDGTDYRIRFKLNNDQVEEKRLRDCFIARIASDARYSTDDEFSDNINYFVTAIVLFGYNAIRYGGKHDENQLEMELKFVKENNQYFIACESWTESEEAAQESVQKAKKSIAIPPWVRHSGDTLKNKTNIQNTGITLWTLAQYFNRSWWFKDSKNTGNAIEVVSEGKKFIIKLRVGFKED